MSIPTHAELERRWWHRLANVIIWSCGLFGALLVISLTVLALDEEKTTHVLFSFEEGFEDVDERPISLSTAYWAERSFKNRVAILSLQEKYKKACPCSDEQGYCVGVTDCREQLVVKDLDKENVMVKRWTEINWWFLLILLLMPLPYVFLRLFYQRVILYIVLGKI